MRTDCHLRSTSNILHRPKVPACTDSHPPSLYPSPLWVPIDNAYEKLTILLHHLLDGSGVQPGVSPVSRHDSARRYHIYRKRWRTAERYATQAAFGRASPRLSHNLLLPVEAHPPPTSSRPFHAIAEPPFRNSAAGLSSGAPSQPSSPTTATQSRNRPASVPDLPRPTPPTRIRPGRGGARIEKGLLGRREAPPYHPLALSFPRPCV